MDGSLVGGVGSMIGIRDEDLGKMEREMYSGASWRKFLQWSFSGMIFESSSRDAFCAFIKALKRREKHFECELSFSVSL